jgi:hypothetical protein
VADSSTITAESKPKERNGDSCNWPGGGVGHDASFHLQLLAAVAKHVLGLFRVGRCQAGERLAAGEEWQDTGLVFTTCLGAALDAGNVRKMFKRVCTEAGIGDSWTPRELRTSFVSLMSHRGVSIEEIARLVGHASTRTTEIVYRRELRPVITTGAEIMDQLFTETQSPPWPVGRTGPAQPPPTPVT